MSLDSLFDFSFLLDTPEAPTVFPEDEVGSVEDNLRRLRDAVEFVQFANEHDIAGGDDEFHAFEVSFDGDGTTEPYTVNARCRCRTWSHAWTQPDPAQTGRPAVADLMVEWAEHYDSLSPLDGPDEASTSATC